MNQFKYIDGELWLETGKPDFFDPDLTDEEFYTGKKIYENRLHYPCSPELKAILKEGQVLREDEFKLWQDCKDDSTPPFSSFCSYCSRSKGCDAPFVAIPLPEQTISNYKPAIMNKYPDFFPILEENYQAQIAGFYNDDKTDEERKIRNAVIEEYQDLIAIYKSRLISEQPPTVKEEQTTTDVKQVAKEMACKFMAWYVDDPNEEVTKALMELPVDNLIEDVYDYWLIKYFNPETIVSTVPNKTNK